MKSLEQFLEATIVPPSDAKRAADNVASSDKMSQKLTQIQQKRQNERIKQRKYDAPLQTKSGKQLPADKGSAIVRTKKGGTSKEAVGAPKKSGVGVPQSKPQEKGSGSKTYDRVRPKGGELALSNRHDTAAQQRDKINKNSKMKHKGKNYAGKFLKGAAGLARKGLEKASNTKMGQSEIGSGQSQSGSYERKDTKI